MNKIKKLELKSLKIDDEGKNNKDNLQKMLGL